MLIEQTLGHRLLFRITVKQEKLKKIETSYEKSFQIVNDTNTQLVRNIKKLKQSQRTESASVTYALITSSLKETVI
jgi:hypothetical protein